MRARLLLLAGLVAVLVGVLAFVALDVRDDDYLVPAQYDTYEDSDVCDELGAIAGVNDALAEDGYAEDYGSEYDALMEAEGCE